MKRRLSAVLTLQFAHLCLSELTLCFAPRPIAASFRCGAPTRLGETSAVVDPDECSLDDEAAGECLSSAGFILADQATSFMKVTQVYVARVESLRGRFPSFDDPGAANSGSNMIKYQKRRKQDHLHRSDSGQVANSRVANMEYNQMIDENEVVLVDIVRKPGMKGVSRAFPRAGPRKFLHFDPSQVNAAIAVSGGLAPGLNNLCRELVHSLYYLYGANKVYGIRGGFRGFRMEDPDYDPVLLTNELVEDIHHDGGTVLKSSRGGFDIDKILNFLTSYDISQLYLIGMLWYVELLILRCLLILRLTQSLCVVF